MSTLKFQVGDIVKVGKISKAFSDEYYGGNGPLLENTLGIVSGVGSDDYGPVVDVDFTCDFLASTCGRKSKYSTGGFYINHLLETTDRETFLYYTHGSKVLIDG